MAVKVSLTVSEGPDKGASIEFSSGKVVLGRAKGEFPLSDKKVSGRHCQVEIKDDQVFVEDLNSTNGTFLAAKRVDEAVELQNLDVITIGLSRISVSIVEELEDFRRANSIEENNFQVDSNTQAEGSVAENVETQVPHTIAHEAPKPNDTDLPEEGAEYRTTGVQRIEGLIKDEMDAFSKWDDAGLKDTADQKFVPKIEVVLVARKAPEGVTQINCSEEKTTLGRKGVDVRLNDLDLSRSHASIEIVNKTKAYIRDLASTNGTYVNGNKVSFQELRNGDLIQVGQSVFEVHIRQVE